MQHSVLHNNTQMHYILMLYCYVVCAFIDKFAILSCKELRICSSAIWHHLVRWVVVRFEVLTVVYVKIQISWDLLGEMIQLCRRNVLLFSSVYKIVTKDCWNCYWSDIVISSPCHFVITSFVIIFLHFVCALASM